jgi:hypothetical protein
MSTKENIDTATFREILEDNLEVADAGNNDIKSIQAVLDIHEKYHSTHALLAVAAYSPAYFLPDTCKSGYFLDQQLSTHCVAVYVKQNPLDVILAIRGTILEAHDLVADLALAYGFRSLIPRFSRAKKVCKLAIKKYGKPVVSVVGHSIGGAIVIDLSRKFDLPGTAFQPGTALIGLGSEVAWNLFRRYILKKPHQVKIVCTKGFDPIACLAPFTCAGDVVYVDVKCKSKKLFTKTAHFVFPCLSVSQMVYQTHRMDNFVQDIIN